MSMRPARRLHSNAIPSTPSTATTGVAIGAGALVKGRVHGSARLERRRRPVGAAGAGALPALLPASSCGRRKPASQQRARDAHPVDPRELLALLERPGLVADGRLED